MCCGALYIRKVQPPIDYSKYLGPDWKRTYKKSGIQVANHTSWLDIVSVMWTDCPSFLSTEENSKIPIVAQVSNSLQSLYVKRGDSKEKRGEVI